MTHMNLTKKLLSAHLAGRERTLPPPGEKIYIKPDQTLLQDSTGTTACLQFEALGVSRVRTASSVIYVDHNIQQTDFRNGDDHRYLQSLSAKIGAVFSPPGTGICHQLHLENFAKPGTLLLGSDSHTPTSSGIGALAIGAGGTSVAMAMAGIDFPLNMPKVVNIYLTGRLNGFATAKDVALFLLRKFRVKGGLGKIFEYSGPGVETLSVHERACIANMGTEMGLTSSVFPSDEVTRRFLGIMGRPDDWTPQYADEGADYDDQMELDLSSVTPLAACPHLPDNVVEVAELDGLEVNQVIVGSCTNSSYADLHAVAELLQGKHRAPDCEFLLSPGSAQVLMMLSADGSLNTLLSAGVRLLECSCGPCLGLCGAPSTNGVSARTSNRNFEGRSGTQSGKVYLVSPNTAAMVSLHGKFTDPAGWGKAPERVAFPANVPSIRHLFVMPPASGEDIQVQRGPNIVPIADTAPVPPLLEGTVVIRVGDQITTDDIIPASSHINGLRSNLPKLSEYTFSRMDPDFVRRAKAAKFGVIVGGENYGQGSSREQAALCPRFLGVYAVIAKSFARIHRDNLINAGILPLMFASGAEGWDVLPEGAAVSIPVDAIEPGGTVTAVSGGVSVALKNDLTAEELACIRHGGLLAQLRKKYAG